MAVAALLEDSEAAETTESVNARSVSLPGAEFTS